MAANPFTLFSEGQYLATAQEGTVIVAPATVNDGVLCSATGVDGLIGPMPWPRNGTSLPQPGDRVMILWPINGDPWVVGWWPGG